jgi:hypothetical protein
MQQRCFRLSERFTDNCAADKTQRQLAEQLGDPTLLAPMFKGLHRGSP